MERLSLEHQGRTRTWTAVEGDPDTLLLVLHGSRQSGNVMRNFTDRTFETLGATVAYPDGVEHHFNDLRTGFNESARRLNIDDVGFLRKVIAHHAPRRVIGIGFSNGGQMVMRLLFDAPGLLDGAATFGASMPVESNTCVGTSDYQPAPLVSVQGTADPLVPYNGGEAGIGGNNRGQTRSAISSAQFFAELNSCGWRGSSTSGALRIDDWHGPAPVRLITIDGFGHMVPVAKTLDARLGPGTDEITGGEVIQRFFFDERTR